LCGGGVRRGPPPRKPPPPPPPPPRRDRPAEPPNRCPVRARAAVRAGGRRTKRTPPVRTGQEGELKAHDLAFAGSGGGRLDGYTIFVKGGLPGQTVRARIVKRKDGFAESRIVEVLVRSPDEITPPCPHFGPCGGCLWQNLDYARPLEAKAGQVRECPVPLGGIAEPVGGHFAGDRAEVRVVAADAELAVGIAHRGRAVAAAAGLMEHQRSGLRLQALDQIERGVSNQDSFDHDWRIAQNSACGVVNLAAARSV